MLNKMNKKSSSNKSSFKSKNNSNSDSNSPNTNPSNKKSKYQNFKKSRLELKEKKPEIQRETADGIEFEGGDDSLKKKKKLPGGAFLHLNLSEPVLKGIIKRGYKVPTPIQRKAIPIILDGKDVVAMARTGSGKTAAFLIPLFERLQFQRNAIVGQATKFPRAIILSPTRELATQTMKFIKEIGKFINFKVVSILGGDSLDSQFSAIHQKPDIVVATPGRLMHLLVEMEREFKLDGVEYIVFDEADRLFEMGLGEQLSEILQRLPETRQTVMFSATLPRLLVDFTKAGLHDPVLIRLDVDTKLPDTLQLSYFSTRTEDKLAVLLYLLKYVINENEQTLVFVATKHHVEFIHALLDELNISNTYIYSSLDATARKLSLASFRNREINVMIVTDIAARGIDIPILDNVINFHFPPKPKLFMHRVGRVARAGRSGTAYSIVAPDEIAALLDLHLFLGRPIKFTSGSDEKDARVGRIPQELIDQELNVVKNIMDTKIELVTLLKTSKNGYSQYMKSRPNASAESNKRAKAIQVSHIPIHPIFEGKYDSNPMSDLISQMQNYRPNSTIFEIGPKAGSETIQVMKLKRIKDQQSVEKYRRTRSTNLDSILAESTTLEKLSKKDDENFIPYQPKDFHTESGLSVEKNFDKQIQESVMDITGDDSSKLKSQHGMLRWDRKRKRFMADGKDNKAKKIKTESGAWINASYKSDAYKSWKNKSKVDVQEGDEGSDEDRRGGSEFSKKRGFTNRFNKGNEAPRAPAMGKGKRFNTGLKRPEEVLKERKKKEKNLMKNKPGKKGKKGGGHKNFANKNKGFKAGGGFKKGK